MSDLHWQELGAVAPASLADARDAAHAAAQWPSRAARAALPAAEDDSHSNLGWDVASGLLCSHDLGGGHRVCHSIARHALVHRHDAELMSEFPLSESTGSDIVGWLMKIPAVAIGDVSWLARALPYELPASVTVDREAQDSPDLAALAELARWYGNAAGLLDEIAAADPAASEVRCWPHHFDIASLITLAGAGEEATTVGVGMSPGDGSYADPYLYVTPWPYPPASALPDLPDLGHWHTDGFVAAILTAERIIGVPDQGAAVRGFMDAAISACRAVQNAD